MAKRQQSGLELVASSPWWIGIALGLIGYIAIRHGIGWYFTSTHNPLLSGLGSVAATGLYAPIAWMLLIGCWLAALASFIGRRHRSSLLDSQTGIPSLRQISWRQFEQLTGEAFRRQGYVVEETGLGGADGGIDLILRKNGQTTLVQCKQWQNRQVGVKIVREMFGLLMHHRAAAVKIVALGNYTADALRFAQDKPIELIHGGELIATVRSLQATKARARAPMDSLLALTGSMIASLLVIAVLSTATATANAPPQVIAPSVATQPTTRSARLAIQRQTQSSRPPAYQPATTHAPQSWGAIHVSDPKNDAQLREWKKRNAESMRILEKSTKEMQYR